MNRGLTLIEFLVAMGIGLLLILTVAGTVAKVLSLTSQQPLAIGTIDTARIVTNTFLNEIRDATTAGDGSYPLTLASSSAIIFYTPYGSYDGSIIRVRYFISNNTLYKGVTKPTGTPATYPVASEKISPLMTLASSTAAIFTYYDGNYVGATTSLPLAQPVSIAQVTYAQMALTVFTKDSRTATTTFTMTAGATMRNLKTNLGN